MPRARTTTKDAETAEKATEAATPTEETPKQGKAHQKPSQWTVKVSGKPQYCGIGACGLQFANGEATTTDARAAAWYRERDGYIVE